MTACSNRKGRAGRVITAALVGALSVGAPAVALAANGGVELQSATQNDAVMRGTVVEYKVGEYYRSGSDKVTVSASTASTSKIVITKVDPEGPNLDTVDVTDPASYGMRYFQKATKDQIQNLPAEQIATINGVKYVAANADGTTVNMPSVPGSYIAALWCGANFMGADLKAPVLEFDVVADSLEGTYLANADGEALDAPSYDGATKWSDLTLMKADGTKYAAGEASFDVYAKNDDEDPLNKDSVMEAGDYVVVVKGSGTYAGQSLKFDVTVSKLDLSKADLWLDDVANGKAPVITDVKGEAAKKLELAKSADDYDFKIKDATWGAEGAGTYTYTLSVKKDSDAAKNVEGTAELTFYRLNQNASGVSWTYDGGHVLSDGGKIVIDRSIDADNYGTETWQFKSFDFSKVTGTYKDAEYKDAKLTSDQFSWTIKDAKGNVVSDLTKKGTYTVTLEADSSKLGYDVARSRTSFTLEVKQGTIGKADTTFSYNGKVVTELSDLTYDGADYLSAISVQVKDDKGNTLKAGTDYTVKAYKDGKAVSEIVDAGEYEIKVTSDTYAFEDVEEETLEVVVSPITLNEVSFDRGQAPFKTFYVFDEEGKATDTETGIPYTGSSIADPVVTFEGKDRAGKTKTFVLPADVYTINWELEGKHVDGLKEKGVYTAKVLVNADAKNYKVSSALSERVRVLEDMATGFMDVADEAWFAEPVNQALAFGYMSGRSGTETFAPTEDITRGEVACVLFNMAGGKYGSDDDFGYTEGKGYDTGFSDVDGTRFYGKAIAWAHATGVVNGSNGEFRPEDKVTREEFAAMLANFAELKGEDVEGASDEALGELPDASEVSAWAKQSVAWAVENGVMGNGGYVGAKSSITRGEAAAMAVNYQPKENVVKAAL